MQTLMRIDDQNERHVHVSIFHTPNPALNGTLALSKKEFSHLREVLEQTGNLVGHDVTDAMENTEEGKQ